MTHPTVDSASHCQRQLCTVDEIETALEMCSPFQVGRGLQSADAILVCPVILFLGLLA